MKRFSTIQALAIATLAAMPLQAMADISYTVIYLHPLLSDEFDTSRGLGAAGGLQVGSGTGSDKLSHALVWNGREGTFKDVSPAGFRSSEIAGIANNGQMVGSGNFLPAGSSASSTGINRALLWKADGTVVNLHPSGGKYEYYDSTARGTDGTQQVGGGRVVKTYDAHALLWNGTNKVIDLHPTNGEYISTYAYAVDNGKQVGHGYHSPSKGYAHAMLWSGSADTYIDLNPTKDGYYSSAAYGISGNQQVGSANHDKDKHSHAMLWYGSADNYIDLHPLDGLFIYSVAYDVLDGQQVGYGMLTGTFAGPQQMQHALLWNSSATDYIDLHDFLAPEYIRSFATGFDTNGDIVGYAYDAKGIQHAVLWTLPSSSAAVPEPASLSLLGLGAAALIARRRRSSQGQ